MRAEMLRALAALLKHGEVTSNSTTSSRIRAVADALKQQGLPTSSRDLRRLAKQAGATQKQLLTIPDLKELPEPSWVVDGLIPEVGVAVLYGPSGVGKTFVALSIALAVGAGEPLFGLSVRQGGAVYVAAEGATGLLRRIDAWTALSPGGAPNESFWVYPAAVQLPDDEALQVFISAITEIDDLRLVVIDTMARSMVGYDENTAKDVSIVVAAADRIRLTTGATVLILHHTGKKGDDERGSSALRAAADSMLRLGKGGGGKHLKLAVTKQKEAEELDPIALELIEVEKSLVPKVTTHTATTSDDRKDDVLSVLVDMRQATSTQWLRRCQRELAIGETTFQRRRRELVDDGRVVKKGNGRGAIYQPSSFVTDTGEASFPVNSLQTGSDSYVDLPSFPPTPLLGGEGQESRSNNERKPT